MKAHAYFPLFINMRDKKIIIYGAGNIARRRIQALLPASPQMTVIAPVIPRTLPAMFPGVTWQTASYHSGEISACDFVFAATNDPFVNHQIAIECKKKGIPVNNASCQTECDFFFPAVIRKDDITVGVCSGGTDHKKVRTFSQKLRALLHTPHLFP